MISRNKTRSFLASTTLTASGAVLLCLGGYAQNSADQHANDAPNSGVETVAQASTAPENTGQGLETTTGSSGSGSYFPSLNGTGLINAFEARRLQFSYGATFSEGYQNNIGDTTHEVAGRSTIATPSFQLIAQGPKNRAILQYAPTITSYASSQLGVQALHNASLVVLGDINRQWNWDFSISGNYGDDALRLLAPLGVDSIGSVAAIKPGMADFLASQKVLGSNGKIGLDWRRSERDKIRFSVEETYYRYYLISRTSETATLGVSYDHQVSQRTTLQVYGRAFNGNAEAQCSSGGGGVGVVYRPSRITVAEFAVGPQFNSGHCGKQQAFNFHAGFSQQLKNRASFYAVANREFSTAYRAHNRWEDNFVAGFSKSATRKTSISADTGFVRSDPVDRSSTYHGYFVSSSFEWRLGSQLSALAIYRWYYRFVGDLTLNRQVAMISLVWNPRPVLLRR